MSQRIRVPAASGVRHTDPQAAEGDGPVKPSLPFVPGHEDVVVTRLAEDA